MFGLKAAYEKAARASGHFPTTDDVVNAFEYLEWESPSGRIRMANGNGHQAILDSAVGFSRYNSELDEVEIVEVIHYPAECVNAPPEWKSEEWMAAGFPGAKCD